MFRLFLNLNLPFRKLKFLTDLFNSETLAKELEIFSQTVEKF